MNSLFSYIDRIRIGIKTHLASFFFKRQLGRVGDNTIIRYGCQLEGDSLKNVCIGNNCYIDAYNIIGCRAKLIVDGEKVIPHITIGNGCNLGQYNHITAVNRIAIGDNLLTGRFVLITDNSHGIFETQELKKHPSNRAVTSKGEVIIGNNVWIGDKATILPGVHVGDGCIIGANAVVSHDVPAYSVVAGNPAKILKSIKVE